MPSSEIAYLLQLTEEGYAKQAWHGPNLRGSIRGLTAQQAAWRPAKDRHNIWELVVHAAYWKYAVRRRLLGERRGSFARKGSNFFSCPDELTEAEWKSAVALLAEEHRKLTAAIAAFPPEGLDRRAPGSKTVARRLIAGIALHDVYHAGQIQLLKRLMRSTDRRD